MPWRETSDPYLITISEVMLQQTQVSRVLVKFPEFIAAFPDFGSLAGVGVADILKVWQGMGYNRRALNLQKLGQRVITDYDGQLPSDPSELVMLPGIGPHTAGSIAAFAFNRPSVFVETNIRRVFIHHFFEDLDGVSDKQLLPLVEAALDRDNPREWYWALMDYGAMLAKSMPNPNRRSQHYAVQSKFEGSDRQIRGQILRVLMAGPSDLAEISDPRRDKIITDLMAEGFIEQGENVFRLKA